MKVIAFDPSKSTGWAFWDTAKDHSSIRCGVFQMPDKADHYYTSDQIGLKVTNFIKELVADKNAGRPDFAVLEEQSLAKIGNTSADAMIYPWVATSAIVATLANFGIPYGTLPAASWRKAFYGEGFKPPLDNKGKKDWKKASVTECERVGIVLPPQKTISHNAAEACALAICCHVNAMKLHARRYEPALLALRMARNSRPTGDLFGSAA
ncbi:Holliday junction resolvasome RuvABC endonuclease subunit [Pararhizobium capsulatum DSM 1112]|uniref:Holliday junction resolvasome RuvABC endonuclease subunit n=1 Tax=Pararhizobium capsulatum DSM 1112 TaxID=1121113 RepID=A0ABU0BP42_9HYPH|nr:hypothetical protein [Pararhizobium capsulatum]MDQ0320021.1 Holliday junction resolvasome RuvABC endonuclease subunit [Pararhizobium capsulatum DSM 1112]